MHRPTIDVYEGAADHYATRRGVQRPEQVDGFAAALPADGLRLDLGCGPGHYVPLLGRPVVAADATASMVARVRSDHPDVPVVRADLADLPFGRHAFAGVWSSKAHQHLPAADLPLALADVHRALEVGGRFELTVFSTPLADPGAHGPDGVDGGRRPTFEEVTGPDSGDDLPGRLFTWWDPDHLAAVVAAAGFSVDRLAVVPAEHGVHDRIEITATALRALPDHVGPDLRLLCCGLNPSLHAADAGVGYVTGSNRFWRALTAAGLCTRDRDPRHLARHDRVGMTDLVKRATARADELTTAEYRVGAARLADLCAWLRPGAVAVVGLAGWRAAVDRRAGVGWQPERLSPVPAEAHPGTPVYVLPSTSGLNAGTSLAALVDHLRAAADPPPG